MPNPKGIIYNDWHEYGLSLDRFENLHEFYENLQEIDALETSERKEPIETSYKTSVYKDAIEKYYLNHRDKREKFCIETQPRRNFHKITRENFLHMSETVDYISYLQILESFPISLQPSYVLRQCKKNTTYLDIFLQKNPNLFYNTG